ncbi:hypothetical protein MMC30_005948 [Trapelia coarctata]|nr:hypothetical protein [Trapelia coarctata]
MSPSSLSQPTRICVFASTVLGNSPTQVASACSLAQALHAHNIHLIYGGGTTGLMGALAKERVRLGGKENVVGIIPGALTAVERPGDVLVEEGWLARLWEWLGRRRDTASAPGVKIDSEGSGQNQRATLLSEDEYGLTIVTPSLAARKALMIQLVSEGGPGSGFIALSGGFGTLDEVLEVLATRQLGIHGRGMCLVNVEGCWDGLVGWVEGAVGSGFLREEYRGLLGIRGTAEEAVEWEVRAVKGFDAIKLTVRGSV